MTDRQVARIVACELQFDISNEDVALLDRVLALEELIDAEHTGWSLEDRICTIEDAVGLAEERERAEAEETAKREAEAAAAIAAVEAAVAKVREEQERADGSAAAKEAAAEEARKAEEEQERARVAAEAAAAEERAANEAAEAAAAKAAAEEEARRAAEEEAAAQKAREEAAAAERERAAAEAAAAERALLEERAAEKIQAVCRAQLQQRVFYKAWKSVRRRRRRAQFCGAEFCGAILPRYSAAQFGGAILPRNPLTAHIHHLPQVVTLQKLHRGRVIKAIVRQLLTAVGLLRAGNIFLKFSADGPPHDRLVWVSDDMRTLLWCNPEKNRTHDLKPDARMDVREVAAVTEGIKTEVFKKAVKKSEGGGVIGKMTMMNSLQKKPSQVLKKGEAVNELCCLSVLSSSRTIDLVAVSNRVRDDWLWALRLLLVHFNSTSSLKEVANQRRLAGEKRTAAGLHRAASVLTDDYKTLEFVVQRTNMGMGIVMDSASNVIFELETGSTGLAAGLRVGDLVAMVDSTVVTVIEDGMVVPRAAVNSAIDPTRTELKLTVFRPSSPPE